MSKAKTVSTPQRAGTEDAAPPQPASAPAPAPEFPGCKPVHLPRADLEDSDQRLEYWDGRTETAWICEPASPYHERRSRRLNTLVERIAQVRGAPIDNYGSMDLRQRDSPYSIMQVRWSRKSGQEVKVYPGP